MLKNRRHLEPRGGEQTIVRQLIDEQEETAASEQPILADDAQTADSANLQLPASDEERQKRIPIVRRKLRSYPRRWSTE